MANFTRLDNIEDGYTLLHVCTGSVLKMNNQFYRIKTLLTCSVNVPVSRQTLLNPFFVIFALLQTQSGGSITY